MVTAGKEVLGGNHATRVRYVPDEIIEPALCRREVVGERDAALATPDPRLLLRPRPLGPDIQQLAAVASGEPRALYSNRQRSPLRLRLPAATPAGPSGALHGDASTDNAITLLIQAAGHKLSDVLTQATANEPPDQHQVFEHQVQSHQDRGSCRHALDSP